MRRSVGLTDWLIHLAAVLLSIAAVCNSLSSIQATNKCLEMEERFQTLEKELHDNGWEAVGA